MNINITLESLTNSIGLKSQLMMKELRDDKVKEAEEIADKISGMIFQYRKLSEELTVSEIKR